MNDESLHPEEEFNDDLTDNIQRESNDEEFDDAFTDNLRRELDYIEDKTQFEKDMGESKYAIKFSSGFADDLKRIITEDPEEREREDEEHWEKIKEKIKLRLEAGKEIIFYTDTYTLDAFVDSTGKFSTGAYHELNKDMFYNTTMEEYEEKVWKWIELYGIVGWLDVFFVFDEYLNEDQEDCIHSHHIICMRTPLYCENEFKRDCSISYTMLIDRLRREHCGLSRLIYKEDSNKDKDFSWKEEIWKHLPTRSEFLKITDDLPPDEDMFIHVRETLECAKETLNNMKEHYYAANEDQGEFTRDEELIENAFKRLRETTREEHFRITEDELVIKPEKYNSISDRDVAITIKHWIKSIFGNYEYKLRSATKEEVDTCQKDFVEFLQVRMKQVKEEIGNDKDEEEKDKFNTLEYMKKFDIPDWHGKSYDDIEI